MQFGSTGIGALQAVLKGMVDAAVVVLDVGGTIRVWNTGAERLFQCPVDQVIGQRESAYLIGPEAMAQALEQDRLAALAGESVASVRWYDSFSGARLLIESTLSPVRDDDGNIVALVRTLLDQTARHRREQQIEQLSRIDPLTNLPNRAAFHERMREAEDTAARYGGRLIVHMIDLDHFKAVNDTFGHSTGDLVLREAARRMSAVIRTGDLLARIGGDEFALLQTNVQDLQSGGRVAAEVVRTVSEPYLVHGQEILIGASVGIAAYPDNGTRIGQLLRMADVALYRAKAETGAGFQYFNVHMDDVAQQLGRSQALVRRAVERRAFALHYQPQLDAHTGRVVGLEALLRCTDPALSKFGTEAIVAVAARCGLMRPLGRWIFEEACAQGSRWRKMGLFTGRICINRCASELSDPYLLEHVESCLHEHELDPHQVEIELTEHQLYDFRHQGSVVLAQLRGMGLTIAIDDFGTGYSSLSYLSRLPVDRIKLDRTFVQHLPEDRQNSAIARAVLGLAKTLTLEVVAEGVESAEQADFLRDIGCDAMQGFLYSRPLPTQAMTNWLALNRERGVPAIAAAPRSSLH